MLLIIAYFIFNLGGYLTMLPDFLEIRRESTHGTGDFILFTIIVLLFHLPIITYKFLSGE